MWQSLEDELVGDQLSKRTGREEFERGRGLAEEQNFRFGGECCCFDSDG
jgi:hypothetical protein